MLSTYEVIAEITHKMRTSAKCGDWRRLSELEQLCKEHSEKSHAWKKLGSLSRQEIERKVASLNVILTNDKEIRDYLEPWQKKLADLMNTKQKNRSITTPDYCNI